MFYIDVQDFIKLAVESSELTKEEIENYQSKQSFKKLKLQGKSFEVKATWSRYRNRYVTSSRINNGAKFVKENFEILESVERDFGVSKFT